MDFVASSPKGKKDGSQGLERSVNPWDVPKRNMHPEGMREQREAAKWYLASLQDALSFPTVPGIYASLQSLATISNPFGIMPRH
jgi:hypothetical protein